jgi:hypothetical protein
MVCEGSRFRLFLLVSLLGAAGPLACDPAQNDIFLVDPLLPAGVGAEIPAAAGAGGMDQAGAGGSPETTKPDAGILGTGPHLDPNARFDWTETAPGHGTCGPATFAGNFSCEMSPALLAAHVEGSLLLNLDGRSESQLLGITAGELTAFDDGMEQFLSAAVGGELNCATRALTAAVQPTKTTVTGNLHGFFDPRALTITGDVTLEFEAQTTCKGTYSVRATQ